MHGPCNRTRPAQGGACFVTSAILAGLVSRHRGNLANRGEGEARNYTQHTRGKHAGLACHQRRICFGASASPAGPGFLRRITVTGAKFDANITCPRKQRVMAALWIATMLVVLRCPRNQKGLQRRAGMRSSPIRQITMAHGELDHWRAHAVARAIAIDGRTHEA